MRILELFSGIGAISLVASGKHQVQCAIDINQSAMKVYQANFSTMTLIQEITSLTSRQLESFDAELWWMSPPCQPFTRRGLQRDLEDERSKPLIRLIKAIEAVRPEHIALENVIGFQDSAAFQLLCNSLQTNGYEIGTVELCSTLFGLPNLRPRFFVAASRTCKPTLTAPIANGKPKRIGEFLDNDLLSSRWGDLSVAPSQIKAYREAINVISADDRMTRCFTSAYGKSFIRSGSYLRVANGKGFRRFSPSEQVRLLGFPKDFVLPESLSTRQLWKLIGNTVSLPCAELVVSAFK